MTIHMAMDQIEDRLELARLQSPALREELRRMAPPTNNTRLEKVVNQLEELCREAVSASPGPARRWRIEAWMGGARVATTRACWRFFSESQGIGERCAHGGTG